MKHFSWNYFQSTGQIDAYLLYKDCENVDVQKNNNDENENNIIEQ